MNNLLHMHKGITKAYLLFYLVYIILITFTKFTAYYQYLNLIYKIVILISIVLNVIFLIMLNVTRNKSNIFEYIFTFLILISIIFGFSTKLQIMTVPLASIYLFIINLRNVNPRVFVKKDLKIKCCLLFLIVSLYLLHLCPGYSYYVLSRNGILRFNMGFSADTMFSGFVFCIILSYMIYLGKKAYKLSYLLLFLIMSYGVFLLTDTRGVLTSELIIIILLFLGKNRFIRYIIKLVSIPLIIIISALALIIPLGIKITSPSFMYWNKLFSNRLVLQQLAIKWYPIKAFGYGKLNMKLLAMFNGDFKVYVDNTYLLLLMVSGIIGFVIFEFILLKSCYMSIHYNNYMVCIMLISLSVLFVTEVFFYNIDIYVPIIYAFMLDYRNKNDYKTQILDKL